MIPQLSILPLAMTMMDSKAPEVGDDENEPTEMIVVPEVIESTISPSSSSRIGEQWVAPCRLKLKKRELELIRNRQSAFYRILEHSMDLFRRQNHRYFIELRRMTTVRVQRMDQINHHSVSLYFDDKFLSNVTASCSAAFTVMLDRWNGVTKSRKFSANEPVDFHDYYKTAKNWFDQRKVDLLTDLYWIPLFNA